MATVGVKGLKTRTRRETTQDVTNPAWLTPTETKTQSAGARISISSPGHLLRRRSLALQDLWLCKLVSSCRANGMHQSSDQVTFTTYNRRDAAHTSATDCRCWYLVTDAEAHSNRSNTQSSGDKSDIFCIFHCRLTIDIFVNQWVDPWTSSMSTSLLGVRGGSKPQCLILPGFSGRQLYREPAYC